MWRRWLADWLTSVSCTLDKLAERLARRGPYLAGVSVEEAVDDRTDCELFWLMKHSDGSYVIHGIIARDAEYARKQAWHIPGSLLILDSLPALREKIIENARQRAHERSQRAGAASDDVSARTRQHS